MKKLFSVFLLMILILSMNLNVFAYEQINVNVENVQTTYVDFVFEKDELNKNLLSELSASGIEILQSDENILIRFVIRNFSFAEDFNSQYQMMLSSMEKHSPKIAEEFKNKNLSVDSSFFGYPFGGRTTVSINGSNFDKNINIKMNGKYSLNDGNYVSEGVITPNNIPATIEFGMNSIDSLEIKVSPQNNYKSIDVQYTINSKQKQFNEVSEEILSREGYYIVSKTSELLVLQESYSDIDAFNHLFTLKLGQLFNVIGQIELSASKSLNNTMSAKGMFVESESIDKVTLEIVMPEESTDSVSGHTGETFKYDVTGNAQFNIEHSKINTSTLIIIIIVPLCIIFVVGALLMLGKRSAHIRIK